MLLVALFWSGITPVAGAEPGTTGCEPADSPHRIIVSDTLDVLTLNVGHGRGTAWNQMLVTRDRHQRNLEAVSALLIRARAHVVALQEADASSLWSGRFDHVGFLAAATDYTCSIHGHHADTWLFTFGAALMSGFLMSDTGSHVFESSPPTTTKGFVRATVQWQSGDDATARTITLISVHLDFSRRKVREAQIAEMVDALTGVSTPLIILGDFNADWTADDSPVREVAREFRLRAFMPTAEELGTYKSTKRLDWILISEELEFVDYAVLPDVVSDHFALVAKIGWAADH